MKYKGGEKYDVRFTKEGKLTEAREEGTWEEMCSGGALRSLGKVREEMCNTQKRGHFSFPLTKRFETLTKAFLYATFERV